MNIRLTKTGTVGPIWFGSGRVGIVTNFHHIIQKKTSLVSLARNNINLKLPDGDDDPLSF